MVRTSAEFSSAEEIGNILSQEKGHIVYLKDIAKVTDGYEERESYSRLDTQPVVSLNVVKKSGENLLATSKIMDCWLTLNNPPCCQ